MKIIINNTNSNSEIMIDGQILSVEAHSSSEPISDVLASKWQKVHEFLLISDIEDTPIKKEGVKIVETVEVKDEIEEVVEEVLEVKKEAKIKKIK